MELHLFVSTVDFALHYPVRDKYWLQKRNKESDSEFIQMLRVEVGLNETCNIKTLLVLSGSSASKLHYISRFCRLFLLATMDQTKNLRLNETNKKMCIDVQNVQNLDHNPNFGAQAHLQFWIGEQRRKINEINSCFFS